MCFPFRVERFAKRPARKAFFRVIFFLNSVYVYHSSVGQSTVLSSAHLSSSLHKIQGVIMFLDAVTRLCSCIGWSIRRLVTYLNYKEPLLSYQQLGYEVPCIRPYYLICTGTSSLIKDRELKALASRFLNKRRESKIPFKLEVGQIKDNLVIAQKFQCLSTCL